MDSVKHPTHKYPSSLLDMFCLKDQRNRICLTSVQSLTKQSYHKYYVLIYWELLLFRSHMRFVSKPIYLHYDQSMDKMTQVGHGEIDV